MAFPGRWAAGRLAADAAITLALVTAHGMVLLMQVRHHDPCIPQKLHGGLQLPTPLLELMCVPCLTRACGAR